MYIASEAYKMENRSISGTPFKNNRKAGQILVLSGGRKITQLCVTYDQMVSHTKPIQLRTDMREYTHLKITGQG